MTQRLGWTSTLVVVALTGVLDAQAVGTATGKGMLDKSGTPVPFAPRVASAHMQNIPALKVSFTWIVLTEKAVPAGMLAGATDHTEALAQWCGKEKTPFAAVQLDADGEINSYVTCAANGGTNTEMVNTANGLASIVVKIAGRDALHIKGSLKTGTVGCSAPNGSSVYCTATGDYTFDAAFVK